MEKPQKNKAKSVQIIVFYLLILIADVYLVRHVFSFKNPYLRLGIELSLCLQISIYLYGGYIQIRNILTK